MSFGMDTRSKYTLSCKQQELLFTVLLHILNFYIFLQLQMWANLHYNWVLS